MHATWYEKQGSARDVIQCGEMPVPESSFGEVRVKVHASGVNPSDTKGRSGWGGSPHVDVNFGTNLPITSAVLRPNETVGEIA